MKENLETAFTILLEEHKGIVYKIARSYGNGPDERKDLFQEIALNLWKAFPSFKGDSKVSTWIYKVALYTSITSYRRDLKRRNYTESFFIDSHDLFEDEDNAIQSQRLHALYVAIDKLSAVDKGIVLLVLDDLSYIEIAEIIGLKPTAIAMRIKRTKEKLAELMKDQIN
jgi:RNA polymerase sigma factor (sigma-70 family)